MPPQMTEEAKPAKNPFRAPAARGTATGGTVFEAGEEDTELPLPDNLYP